MTEAEWNNSTDAGRMLSFVAGSAGGRFLSERKLRLLLVGCCRRWWPVFTAERLTTAIETAEQYADGGVSDSDRDPAWRQTRYTVFESLCRPNEATHYEAVQAAFFLYFPDNRLRDSLVDNPGETQAADGLSRIRRAAGKWLTQTDGGIPLDPQAVIAAEQVAQANLLRCVAGNPFRPVHAGSGWRTAPVVGIAEAAYAGRAFDRLPIMADALEDAGCADADILTHCRAHPEHARGCWVVDLLLGKE
jgi:hypothetical protein